MEYFFNKIVIVLSIFFICSRILNDSQIHKKMNIVYVICSLMFSFIAMIFKKINNQIDIVIILILCFFAILICSKKSIKKVFCSIIISYTLAIGINNLALFSVSGIIAILNINYKSFENLIIVILTTSLIHLLYTFLLLKIKRFKSTFSLLLNDNFMNLALIISITVLLSYIIMINFNENPTVFIMSFLFIISFSAVLCVLWYKETQNAYKMKLLNKDLDEAYNTIKSKDEYIDELLANNDNLAKIIHKDNKLIPSVELAFKNFVLEIQNEYPELSIDCDKHISYISTISKERMGIIYQTELIKRNIEKTGIFSIDNLLNYMLTKSINNNIIFCIAVNCNIKNLVFEIIDEESLRTIIADLIDNAIISVKDSEVKKILVTFNVVENYYEFSIYDSGELFCEEALQSLGVTQYTSHQNEGGSGIGMITLFEILRKYSASFVLDEVNASDSFSKFIKICFDNKMRFDINTSKSINVF